MIIPFKFEIPVLYRLEESTIAEAKTKQWSNQAAAIFQLARLRSLEDNSSHMPHAALVAAVIDEVEVAEAYEIIKSVSPLRLGMRISGDVKMESDDLLVVEYFRQLVAVEEIIQKHPSIAVTNSAKAKKAALLFIANISPELIEKVYAAVKAFDRDLDNMSNDRRCENYITKLLVLAGNLEKLTKRTHSGNGVYAYCYEFADLSDDNFYRVTLEPPKEGKPKEIETLIKYDGQYVLMNYFYPKSSDRILTRLTRVTESDLFALAQYNKNLVEEKEVEGKVAEKNVEILFQQTIVGTDISRTSVLRVDPLSQERIKAAETKKLNVAKAVEALTPLFEYINENKLGEAKINPDNGYVELKTENRAFAGVACQFYVEETNEIISELELANKNKYCQAMSALLVEARRTGFDKYGMLDTQNGEISVSGGDKIKLNWSTIMAIQQEIVDHKISIIEKQVDDANKKISKVNPDLEILIAEGKLALPYSNQHLAISDMFYEIPTMVRSFVKRVTAGAN